MGTTERKQKEREELQDLILQSARSLFVKNGVEQTTIRNIAEKIDYSVGTVYKYFRDKNAILHALHTQGFQDLGGQFAVLQHVKDPMERLRTMGKVYIQFAQHQPDMYDLMFSLKAPMDFLETIHQQEWNEGKATFGALRITVKQCMDEGHFKGHHLEPLAYLIWSCVHGMCSLEISNRVDGVNLRKPKTIVMDAYHEFVRMIDQF
jgi:AcrR family transcriptional regulator